MKNKKVIILIILSVAAVFSLIYGISTPSKIRREIRSKSVNAQKKGIAATQGKSIASTAPATRQSSRSAYTSWARDPFSSGPAVSSPTTISDMRLTGILWDDVAPLAMISDNPIAVGDKIGGYTVVDIQKDKVMLTDGTKDYELTLPY